MVFELFAGDVPLVGVGNHYLPLAHGFEFSLKLAARQLTLAGPAPEVNSRVPRVVQHSQDGRKIQITPDNLVYGAKGIQIAGEELAVAKYRTLFEGLASQLHRHDSSEAGSPLHVLAARRSDPISCQAIRSDQVSDAFRWLWGPAAWA